eukprot:3938909-Rhodomonas_salina.2
MQQYALVSTGSTIAAASAPGTVIPQLQPPSLVPISTRGRGVSKWGVTVDIGGTVLCDSAGQRVADSGSAMGLVSTRKRVGRVHRLKSSTEKPFQYNLYQKCVFFLYFVSHCTCSHARPQPRCARM